MPRATTKPVVAPTTTEGVVWRSVAIWLMPGVNIEEARGDRTRLAESLAEPSLKKERKDKKCMEATLLS